MGLRKSFCVTTKSVRSVTGRVLSDPDDFFARQSVDPSFAAPVSVVLLAGVALNLNTVLVLPAFSGVLS